MGGGIYKLYKKRDFDRKEQNKLLMELVDKITGVIESYLFLFFLENIRDTTSEGISEIHLRDIIFPPTKYVI